MIERRCGGFFGSFPQLMIGQGIDYAFAMARLHHHYEAAFEDLLRCLRVPYVPVNETRRSLVQSTAESFTQQSLKSVDFLVSPPGPQNFLVDIKGRQFPSGGHGRRQYWRNWSTRDDLRSLAEWARYFGPQFTPLLVFAFHIVGDRSPVPPTELWEYRDRQYSFVAIPLAEYWSKARTLSTKWDTVSLRAADFRSLARSIFCWLPNSKDRLGDDINHTMQVGSVAAE